MRPVNGRTVLRDLGDVLVVCNPYCMQCKGTGWFLQRQWKYGEPLTIDSVPEREQRSPCGCQERIAKPDDYDMREMIDACKDQDAVATG